MSEVEQKQAEVLDWLQEEITPILEEENEGISLVRNDEGDEPTLDIFYKNRWRGMITVAIDDPNWLTNDQAWVKNVRVRMDGHSCLPPYLPSLNRTYIYDNPSNSIRASSVKRLAAGIVLHLKKVEDAEKRLREFKKRAQMQEDQTKKLLQEAQEVLQQAGYKSEVNGEELRIGNNSSAPILTLNAKGRFLKNHPGSSPLIAVRPERLVAVVQAVEKLGEAMGEISVQ